MVRAASGFKQLKIVVKYQIMKFFTEKRLVIMFFSIILNIILMILVLSNYKTEYFIPQGFLAPSIIFTNVLQIIFAILLIPDILSGEREKKTGLIMFTQPIFRETYTLGKYISSLLLIIVFNLINYLITFGFAIFVYGIELFPLLAPLLISFLLCTLIGSSYLSLTFLFSSIFNKPILTVILMFFIFFFIDYAILPQMALVTENHTYYSLIYFSHLSWIVLFPPNFIGIIPTLVDYSILTNFSEILPIGLLVMSLYTIIPIFLAIFFENLREFKG